MSTEFPIVARTSKRKVPGTRIFDSSRVFADYNLPSSKANNSYCSHYTRTFHHSSNNSRAHKAGKVNKPDPTNVHFLFENPRFINEPVCHANTEATRSKQHIWWPTEIPALTKLNPIRSSNTTNRSDFDIVKERPPGLGRFSCVEGKRKAASGIIPVIDVSKNGIKTERISYNHLFDSRRDRRERGKLHGSFVWDTTNDTNQKQNRRYAKRHFICSESIDMCHNSVPRQNIISKFESHSAKSRGKINESIPLKESKPMLTLIHSSTEKEEKRLMDRKVSDSNSQQVSNISALHLTESKADRVSPPPHVC